VREIELLYSQSGRTMVDRKHIVQNFLGEVRNVVQRDIDDLRPRLRYDYFQRELADEGKFRSALYDGLGEAIRSLQ
jgi:hypothetical protein